MPLGNLYTITKPVSIWFHFKLKFRLFNSYSCKIHEINIRILTSFWKFDTNGHSWTKIAQSVNIFKPKSRKVYLFGWQVSSTPNIISIPRVWNFLQFLGCWQLIWHYFWHAKEEIRFSMISIIAVIVT